MSERTKAFLLAAGVSVLLGLQLGLRAQELMLPSPWSDLLAIALGGGVGWLIGLVMVEVIHLRLTGSAMTREDRRRGWQALWDAMRPSWWRRGDGS